MRRILSLFAFVVFFFLYNFQIAFTQAINKCATFDKTQELMNANPGLQKQIDKEKDDLENHIKSYNLNPVPFQTTPIYVIPVVFHVIHENGIENIPDAKIFEGIKIVNQDFRLWNPDSIEIDQDFLGVKGNGGIEFRLAQLDPNGNSTTGIDRIVSSETNVGDDGSKLNPWPRNKYLNIWVIKTYPSGAAGYSYLPSTVDPSFMAIVDGIIVNYNYVGHGSGERTLTHEIGHWLNLRHPWGPSNNPGLTTNCNVDDNVNDTPNTVGVDNGGCDTNQVSCGSLDNVQNFMDYSSCERMFTQGQVDRVRATLNSSTAQRNNLWTNPNLLAAGVYGGAAVFYASLTEVCVGTSVSFTDESYNGITSWSWSFPGGTPATSTDKYPSVVYDMPGFYDITLTVSNDTGSTSTTKPSYIKVSSSGTLPYLEEFETEMGWAAESTSGVEWEYSSVSFSGTGGAIWIDNFDQGNDGEIDQVVGSLVDLSVLETGVLNFKVAYAQRDPSNNDILKVYTSGDCGNSWTQDWIRGGLSLSGGIGGNGLQPTMFSPSSDTSWIDFSANISIPALTENFRMMFEFIGDGGNNIYIDNVMIDGVYEPVPILVSPTNYAIQQPLNVILDWNAIHLSVPIVDLYDYEIDTVIGFNSTFLISGSHSFIDHSDNNTDTEYQLSGLDSVTTVYWRVRTRTGADTSDWSSVWQLSTYETIIGVKGIDRLNTGIGVYPNPTDENATVFVELQRECSNFELIAYDYLGREIDGVFNKYESVLSRGKHVFPINCNSLSGIIYLKITIDEIPYFTSLVIVK